MAPKRKREHTLKIKPVPIPVDAHHPLVPHHEVLPQHEFTMAVVAPKVRGTDGSPHTPLL